MRARATALIGVLLCAFACGSPGREGVGGGTVSDSPGLRPVALPPVAGMSESVAEQMQDRYAAVERERTRAPGHDADYAQAYGELGKVLLGANYLDAAEPALLNAATLDSSDMRWPYYLGHLYRSKGAIRESAQQFERALQHRPTDVPALIWLADAYLSEGRPDEADPLVRRALNADSASVAALYQAGRLALARGDHAVCGTPVRGGSRSRSSRRFHSLSARAGVSRPWRHTACGATSRTAVAREPYRGTGRSADGGGSEHCRRTAGVEVRGVEALNRRDWPAAVEAFRQGTALAPRSAPLHHRLGTALAMMGKQDEARREFEAAVAASPGYAKAHYSLGVLLEDRGNDEGALDRYAAAVRERA